VRAVLAVAVGTLATACASGPCACPEGAPAPARPAAVARTAPAPAAGELVDHRDGSRVAFDAMVDRLATASVVYVGERHDQAAHHAFQARVLEALLGRWKGKPVALGMEMFQRPFQPALDAYVKKEIDEKEMLARTEWAARWGFGWEMYAPMLRLARERDFPVVALNAPREVTKAVAKKGLDGLTTEQRAELPPLGMDDAGHRAFVKDAFGAHGASMPPETFERFYTAQVIWEETMSSAVAEWLAAHGPDAKMVVVVGAGHVADRFGVPARADRKSGTRHLSVVAEVVEPAEPGETPRAPRLDARYADYTAWFAPSAPPKAPGPGKASPEKNSR
jgi:uncharacterized iron-regulated protein